MKNTQSVALPKRKKQRLSSRILSCWQLYLMLVPAIIYFIIFHYIPMYGVQVAFRDFDIAKGVTGSPWIGLENFQRFFDSYYFKTVIVNTLTLSFYGLIAGFPLPIILALFVTQIQNGKFRKVVQTITYAPHFISVVIVAGMLYIFLSPSSGLVNIILQKFGNEPINFMADAQYYKHLYVWSGVWQGMGWGSVIYVAALSAVDPGLYEAADIDGATKLKKILHIDLPSIIPTAVIMLIMDCGKIMNQSAVKALLLQTPPTAASVELISTYVYKAGLINNDFGYSTAIGLFNNIINIILLITVNKIADKVSGTSLW